MLATALVLLGCQTPRPAPEKPLQAPIDCRTARRDLALLEAERVTVAQQIAAGVHNMVPTAAVIGILTGDTKERRKKATGEYNREIDERIDQIHLKCGIRPEELSEDGLFRVRNARVDFVEAKPGADFARYDSILILPVLFHFKGFPRNREIDDSALQAVRRDFHMAFETELSRGGYQVVERADERVLLLRAGLVDIVLTGYEEPAPPEDRSYAAEVKEATLVVEIRDAVSGELLAHAVDNRSIGGIGSYRHTRARNRADALKEFRRWAKLLRERLDSIRALEETRIAD